MSDLKSDTDARGYRLRMVQDPSRVDVSLEPLDEYLVIQPTSGSSVTST